MHRSESNFRILTLAFLLIFAPFSLYIKHHVRAYLYALAPAAVGKQVENFSLPDMRGNMADFYHLAEGKSIVLINIWASWCAPCKMELPILVELYSEKNASGLEIIAINIDADPQEAIQFVLNMPLPFPILSDPTGEILPRFGLNGIPATLVLDSEHRVLEVISGAGPDIAERVKNWLEQHQK